MTDPDTLRRASESALANVGARINPDLPPLDVAGIVPREAGEVARRALALNALVRVGFGASCAVALRWLETHGLASALQPDELELLRKPGRPAEADRWVCLH